MKKGQWSYNPGLHYSLVYITIWWWFKKAHLQTHGHKGLASLGSCQVHESNSLVNTVLGSLYIARADCGRNHLWLYGSFYWSTRNRVTFLCWLVLVDYEREAITSAWRYGVLRVVGEWRCYDDILFSWGVLWGSGLWSAGGRCACKM